MNNCPEEFSSAKLPKKVWLQLYEKMFCSCPARCTRECFAKWPGVEPDLTPTGGCPRGLAVHLATVVKMAERELRARNTSANRKAFQKAKVALASCGSGGLPQHISPAPARPHHRPLHAHIGVTEVIPPVVWRSTAIEFWQATTAPTLSSS